jgi:hypothetical protein
MDTIDPFALGSYLRSLARKGTLKQWYDESRTRDKVPYLVVSFHHHAETYLLVSPESRRDLSAYWLRGALLVSQHVSFSH